MAEAIDQFLPELAGSAEQLEEGVSIVDLREVRELFDLLGCGLCPRHTDRTTPVDAHIGSLGSLGIW